MIGERAGRTERERAAGSDDGVAAEGLVTCRHEGTVAFTSGAWNVFDEKSFHEVQQAFDSYKMVDGRNTNVYVTSHGYIMLQYVSNVIIHSIHVHHCKPSNNTNLRAFMTHMGWKGVSNDDKISMFGSCKIWI
ncbi:probable pectate lyase 12 [Arachis hypogaea]|uniref:probable pectate lyase 12 n=1 Tax=Arachis hypogaea TaxID=3818 RepID=UPI000DED6E5B|nr:probable pectate lyase 12 [Arachis hypogaea]